MKKIKALILTGGHKHAATESLNVGDVAQLEHLILTLQTHIPHCDTKIIAHSINDKPALANLQYSHHVIEFINPRYKARILRHALAALRSLALIALAVACRAHENLRKKILSRTPALKEIAEQDALIVSGSGTLNSSYLYGTGIIWCITIHIANLLRTPTILIGQQIGPLNSPISRKIVSIAIRNSRFIGVRDEESLKLALELGCETNCVQFTGDEGRYILPIPDLPLGRSLKPFRDKRYISVHYRIDRNCPFEDSIEIFSKTVDHIAKALNAAVLLIPFSYGSDNSDLEDCKKLLKLLQTEAKIIDSFKTSSNHKFLISESSAAIGVANHFCVFAASVNIPTLAIYGSTYMEQKLNGVARSHDHVMTINVDDLEGSHQIARAFVNHCSKFTSLRSEPNIPATSRPAGYSNWISMIKNNHEQKAENHLDG